MFKSSVSLHSLLLVLTCIIVYGLFRNYNIIGANIYTNYSTVLLSAAYALINAVVILDSRNNNNVLLLMLAIWNLLFCVARIYTLQITDFSNPFLRCDATVSNVNDTLILLILSTLFLWMGLHISSYKSPIYHQQLIITNTNVRVALLIFWFAVFVDFLSGKNIPVISSIATIVTGLFLRPVYIFYMLIIYFLCNRNRISDRYTKFFVGSLIFFVIYRTLGGSRAGIYVVAKMALFVSLVLGFSKIKIRTLLLGLALVPVVAFFFAFATFMRRTGGAERSMSEKIEVATYILSSTDLIGGEEATAMLFDRLGYFDYACEMVTSKDGLKTVVDIPSEVKSIIDNVLTPGFDIFDQARISNVIDKYYTSHRAIRKSEISDQNYQSDELTLFGEMYLLFPVPLNFVALLFIGLFLKKQWRGKKSEVKERDIIYKSVLLYMFEKSLSSYGIDWLVLDIVSFVIIYKVYDIYVFGKSFNLINNECLYNPHNKMINIVDNNQFYV